MNRIVPLRAMTSLALIGSLIACASGDRDHDDLAADIERQVVAAHPDVHLERFARFYAHDGEGSVTAIYLFANEGHEPIIGKVGERRWTAREKLPLVNDGGCWVINVKYNVPRHQLVSVECNGVA
jgi:hypothetical protein